MSVQVIEKNGKPEGAVIPYEEYQHLKRCEFREWFNMFVGGSGRG